MGVLKILTWYKSSIAPRRTNINPKKLEAPGSLFIDLDELIHLSSQEVYKYGINIESNFSTNISIDALDERVIYGVISSLSSKVSKYRPKGLLFIASNGTVPNAKLYYEKSLRFRHLSRKTHGFDVSKITSGTSFMRRLSQEVRKWISNNESLLPGKTIYSDDMSPGESRQKMSEIMRSGQIPKGQVTVIVSSDPGIIPISMVSMVDDIYVVSLTTRTASSSGGVSYRHNEYIISIKAIVEQVYLKMSQKEHSVRDFLIILNIFGNEYIPAMPFARDEHSYGFDSIFSIYGHMSKPLSRYNGTIIWDNLLAFFRLLSKDESNLLKDSADEDLKGTVIDSSKVISMASKTTTKTISKTARKTNRVTSISDFNYNEFRSAWYSNVFAPKFTESTREILDFSARVLASKGMAFVTPDLISEMCMEYLRGISWCTDYLFGGYQRVDVSWQYDYYYSPLLGDMIDVLSRNRTIDTSSCGNNFINPLHRLMCVVPLYSFNLLPPKIARVFMPGEHGEKYPYSIITEPDGSKSWDEFDPRWSSVILIPFPNPFEITKWVRSKNIDDSVIKYFKASSDMIVTRRKISPDSRPKKGGIPSTIPSTVPSQKQKSAVSTIKSVEKTIEDVDDDDTFSF